jgi:hypothetical protein
VATVQFFSILLMDQLRRAHRNTTAPIMPDGSPASVLYSMMVIPSDYGLLCVVLGTMCVESFFRGAYTVLFACNLALLVLALPKRYREVGSFGPGKSS